MSQTFFHSIDASLETGRDLPDSPRLDSTIRVIHLFERAGWDSVWIRYRLRFLHDGLLTGSQDEKEILVGLATLWLHKTCSSLMNLPYYHDVRYDDTFTKVDAFQKCLQKIGVSQETADTAKQEFFPLLASGYLLEDALRLCLESLSNK